MTRCFLLSVVSALVLDNGTATAAVISRDWKTPGDGLLTYDDVNRREWLHLSVSRLDQFPAPRLENAIAEFSPGGLFDGFTWAKGDDVRALAQSAGIDTSTLNRVINQVPTSQLIDLLGRTAERDESFIYRIESVGFIDQVQTSGPFAPRQIGAVFRVNFIPNRAGGYAGLLLSDSSDSLDDDSTGLMLYRVVPEPTSSSLALVELLVFVCYGRVALKRSEM